MLTLCGDDVMKKSNVLIFDEPTNGLDPEGIVEMRNLLIELNKERNITILISSHILSELYLSPVSISKNEIAPFDKLN